MTNAARLVSYLRPERPKLILASAYSVLNKVFDIAPELLIGVAVDVVVKREESFLASLGVVDLRDQLMWLGILTISIWGFESLFQFLHQLEWRNIAQRVQHRFRLETYDRVQRLTMAEIDRQRTGDLATVLNEDVNQLERFLNDGPNSILQTLVSTVLVSIIFFILAPQVAVFAMMPIPIILFVAFYFQRHLGVHYDHVRRMGGALGAQVSGFLSGLATVKAFTAETQAHDSILEASDAYQAANRGAIRWSSAFVPVIRMAVLSGFVVTLWYGGIRCLEGYISVGAYSVLVFLTQRLLWPFTRLGETVDLYQRSMASAGRLLDVLELPVEKPRGTEVAASTYSQAIRFEDVSFGYLPGQMVLSHVSVEIPAGKMTAFVGATGSGKSTLIKLLLKFYAPDEGKVWIGDQDLDALDLLQLRQHIGWVGQDAHVFYGSIGENLRLGQPTREQVELEQVVRAAELHEVVAAMPEGYEAHVGEHGGRLSGGQRQRLAIARALLKDPPILVMDEATSAVDNETEAAIQRALIEAARGRTTVVVAHRLSTVRDADHIHVVENGAIVETGTHDELLALNGQYARLWALQTGREISEAVLAG